MEMIQNIGQEVVKSEEVVKQAVTRDECNFCEHSFVGNELRMSCHQCKDFSLCLNCYKAGAEYKIHRNCHDMYERRDYEQVCWPDGFTIQDDLLLLEGIELHGYGSWDLIHTFMKRPINEPLEVIAKHHIVVFGEQGYIYNEKPDINLFQTFRPLKEFTAMIQDKLSSIQIFQGYFNQYSNIAGYSDEFNTNFMNKIYNQPLNLLSDIQLTLFPSFQLLNEVPSSTGEGTGQPYALGSWPKREEFSFELVNKAEYPIMYLHFQPGKENKDSMSAKIRVLQCYANRVLQRHIRKRILYQFSIHRSDRRVDDVSIEADQKQMIMAGESITLTTEMYQMDENVYKFEAENPWLCRAFKTRLEFRQFAQQILKEKETRESIFRLQIARLLGFKSLSRLTEVVNFLKNPQASPADRARFPPGTVQFENQDNATSDKFTLDNINTSNDFSIDKKTHFQVGKVLLSTSKSGLIDSHTLTQKVNDNIYKLETKLNMSHEVRNISLNDKIKILMKQNFHLSANDIQNYRYEVCVQVMQQLDLATFADIQQLTVEQIILLIENLRVSTFTSDCVNCGQCRVDNFSCGKRCFSQYFINQYKLLQYEQKILTSFDEVGSCGCSCQNNIHTPVCCFRRLDKQKLIIRLQADYLPGNLKEKIQILSIEEIEDTENLSVQEMRQWLKGNEQDEDLPSQSHDKTIFNNVKQHDKNIKINSQQMPRNLLFEFFQKSVIPHTEKYTNQNEIIENIQNKVFPYFNPSNQHLFTNRLFDLVLHFSDQLDSTSQMQCILQRSSSLALNSVNLLLSSILFLISNNSLAMSLYQSLSSMAKNQKLQIMLNQTNTDPVQIILSLINTFQGITFLSNSKDISGICNFLLEFSKSVFISSSFNSNISGIETLVQASIGSLQVGVQNQMSKQLDDAGLLDDFLDIFNLDIPKNIIIEHFCRRCFIGGGSIRNLLSVDYKQDIEKYQVKAFQATTQITLLISQLQCSNYLQIISQVLIQSIFTFSSKSPLIQQLLSELNKKHLILLKNEEINQTFHKSFRQKLSDTPLLTCQSTQFSRPHSLLLLGTTSRIHSFQPIARMVNFNQFLAQIYLKFLPENDQIYMKKNSTSIKNQSKFPQQNLFEMLTKPESLTKISKEDYKSARIKLFQDNKSILVNLLSEEKLNEILLVLNAIIQSVEVQLNSIANKNSGAGRIINEAFPSDQINANAAAIDVNLGEFAFLINNENKGNLLTTPIRKSNQLILNILKLKNEDPENFSIVHPVDYLFGSKIAHNGVSEENSVVPMNQNIRKLKQNKPPPGRQIRPTDQQQLSEYIQKYLTRGELALCCLANLQIGNYLSAKVSFVSNGFIITNQILSAFDWRPLLAETMAFLVLAQYNQNDRSTVPNFSDLDGVFIHPEWSSCIPERIFASNKVEDEQSRYKIVQTNISFRYQSNLVLNFDKLKVPVSKLKPRIQRLIAVPGGILIKSVETNSLEAANKLIEKLGSILSRSRVFTDFGEGARMYQSSRILTKKSPDVQIQTDRSFWSEHKNDYRESLEQIKKDRNKKEKRRERDVVLGARSYGQHDNELQQCFNGYTSVQGFGFSDFQRVCPFLCQHLKDNSRE